MKKMVARKKKRRSHAVSVASRTTLAYLSLPMTLPNLQEKPMEIMMIQARQPRCKKIPEDYSYNATAAKSGSMAAVLGS